jgi:hypothetical protein
MVHREFHPTTTTFHYANNFRSYSIHSFGFLITLKLNWKFRLGCGKIHFSFRVIYNKRYIRLFSIISDSQNLILFYK